MGIHGKGFYCEIRRTPGPGRHRDVRALPMLLFLPTETGLFYPSYCYHPLSFPILSKMRSSPCRPAGVSELFPLNTSDLPTSTDQQPGLKLRDETSPDTWVLVKEKAFPGAIAKKTHSQVQQPRQLISPSPFPR